MTEYLDPAELTAPAEYELKGQPGEQLVLDFDLGTACSLDDTEACEACQ